MRAHIICLVVLGCLPVLGVAAEPTAAPVAPHPGEVHLQHLRQLSFGGENAEAYWSFDSRALTMQSTMAGDHCDQIYLLDVPPGDGGKLARRSVSQGHGRNTCSYFFPGGDRVLFSSTRHVGDACPAPPDRSQGYVWPLYNYQIYTARPDGGDLKRLSQTPGYEAEATVCHDGSVVFTSDRDGDLELYRMKLDGSGVTRLTRAPGYDGGAFFSADCKRIVWRADRPRSDAEQQQMQDLLGKRLVRPTRMDLWVADADGRNAHQVTDLRAASFAPFFYPVGLGGSSADRRRIIFSSNYGDPRGREFDIWAINEDGTALERITHAPDFDGFPMFSPDGKQLAFSSNRGGKARGETNVFVAQWQDAPLPGPGDAPADRVAARVAWLADPARTGRGIGTPGLSAAAEEIARWMKAAGLSPGGEVAGGARGWFQPVEVFVGVRDTGSRVTWQAAGAQKAQPAADVQPAAMSDSGSFQAEIAFAGYGITAPDAAWDDLAHAAVKDRVALVLRGLPGEPAAGGDQHGGNQHGGPYGGDQHGGDQHGGDQHGGNPHGGDQHGGDQHGGNPHGGDPHAVQGPRFSSGAARSYSDLRYKAWNLREHGAKAVVFVDPEHDGVPPLTLDGPEGGAGLPVLFADRRALVRWLGGKPDAAAPLKALEEAAKAAQAQQVTGLGTLAGTVSLRRETRTERNVIGMLPAGANPGAGAANPVVLLGAHYDHLGLGGRGSFVPDQHVVHPGADDNASGTAALLEAAAYLKEHPAAGADLYFVAFTGEEVGLVGSGRFVQRLGIHAGLPLQRDRLRAMINFDMVGRLRGQGEQTQPTVVVQGTDSAREWLELVTPQCRKAGLSCRLGGDGYGPSDMTPFYAAGVPVLFFFTGAHADYHRPSDTADKVNPMGVVQVAQLAAEIVQAVGQRGAPLTFQKASGPAPRSGDSRGNGAYLGTIPDYTAMQGERGGVKLSGARPGSPSALAGVQGGDVLVGLGGRTVDTLEDMAFVLGTLKPGQRVEMAVLRGGKRLSLQATVGKRP